MKFLLQLVVVASLSYLGEMFFPWWIVVVTSFLAGLLIPTKGLNAFLSGFLGLGLLWMIYAWIIDLRSESLLTLKVAELLNLNQAILLVVIAGFVGAILGGLGCLTGNYLLRIFVPEKPDSKY
ncbi:MAG: hypothetical protein ACNS62_08345, partial [Candidatus Cyclobacteriaceae bacterium M3_2C_046]